MYEDEGVEYDLYYCVVSVCWPHLFLSWNRFLLMLVEPVIGAIQSYISRRTRLQYRAIYQGGRLQYRAIYLGGRLQYRALYL